MPWWVSETVTDAKSAGRRVRHSCSTARCSECHVDRPSTLVTGAVTDARVIPKTYVVVAGSGRMSSTHAARRKPVAASTAGEPLRWYGSPATPGRGRPSTSCSGRWRCASSVHFQSSSTAAFCSAYTGGASRASSGDCGGR
jgi:hypothetical protein